MNNEKNTPPRDIELQDNVPFTEEDEKIARFLLKSLYSKERRLLSAWVNRSKESTGPDSIIARITVEAITDLS